MKYVCLVVTNILIHHPKYQKSGIFFKVFAFKVAPLGSELLLHLEAHNSTLKKASWDLTVLLRAPAIHNCIKVTCR